MKLPIFKKRKLIYVFKENIIWIDDYSEGMAYFIALNNENYHVYGMVNKNFEIVIEPMWQKLKSFSEGLAPYLDNKCWGFIDRKGIVKIDAAYYDVGDGFSQGLCAVRRSDQGKYGYINKKGVFKISPVYDLAFAFKNGRAKVAIDGKFYFINKKGRYISKDICSYRGI